MIKKRRLKQNVRQMPSAKPVSLVPPPWDMGAEGQANQDRLTTEPATEIDPTTGKTIPNPNGVTRRRRASWIAIYRAKGKVSQAQYNAALEFRHASEGNRASDPLAALAIDKTRGHDPQASAFDARRKYHRMEAAIPKHCLPIIERVVLDDQPVWNRSGGAMARHLGRLAEGLEVLANGNWVGDRTTLLTRRSKSVSCLSSPEEWLIQDTAPAGKPCGRFAFEGQ